MEFAKDPGHEVKRKWFWRKKAGSSYQHIDHHKLIKWFHLKRIRKVISRFSEKKMNQNANFSKFLIRLDSWADVGRQGQ